MLLVIWQWYNRYVLTVMLQAVKMILKHGFVGKVPLIFRFWLQCIWTNKCLVWYFVFSIIIISTRQSNHGLNIELPALFLIWLQMQPVSIPVERMRHTLDKVLVWLLHWLYRQLLIFIITGSFIMWQLLCKYIIEPVFYIPAYCNASYNRKINDTCKTYNKQ